MDKIDELNLFEPLENFIVYITPEVNTGSYYRTLFYGKDKALVEARAKRAFDAVDSYRSPHLSSFGKAQPYFKGWCVKLEYHGLD